MANNKKNHVPEGINNIADYDTIKEIDFTSFLEETSQGSPLFEGFHEDIEKTEKSIEDELQTLYDSIMGSGPATIVPRTMDDLTATQPEATAEGVIAEEETVRSVDAAEEPKEEEALLDFDELLDIPIMSLDGDEDTSPVDITSEADVPDDTFSFANEDTPLDEAFTIDVPEEEPSVFDGITEDNISDEMNDIFGMIDALKSDTQSDDMFAELLSEIETNPNIMPVDTEISSAASLIEHYPDPLEPPVHDDETDEGMTIDTITPVDESETEEEELELDLNDLPIETEIETENAAEDETENKSELEEAPAEPEPVLDENESIFDAFEPETASEQTNEVSEPDNIEEESIFDFDLEDDDFAFEPSSEMLGLENDLNIHDETKTENEAESLGVLPIIPEESETMGQPSSNLEFILDDDAFLAIEKAMSEDAEQLDLPEEEIIDEPAPEKKKKGKKGKKSKKNDVGEEELFGIEALEKDYEVPVEELDQKPEKPVKKGGAGEVIRKIVLSISIITIIVSSGILVNTYFIEPYKFKTNSDKLSEEMIQNVNTHEDVVVDEEIKSANPDVNYPEGMLAKYAQLYAKNDDLRGWVSIPGLSIDLPIAQYTNNEYYLKKDIYGKYTTYGVPFFDYRITDNQFKNLPRNIVVYGHNMRHDDYIFGMLENYRTIDGYLSAPVIECNTIYGDHTWLVYGVFITNAYKKDDNGYVFNYNFIDLGEGNFASYIKELDKRKLYTTGVTLEPTDNILTLSTCCYDFENARLVVVAREKREGEVISADPSKCYLNQNPKYPQAWYDTYNKSNPYADDANW